MIEIVNWSFFARFLITTACLLVYVLFLIRRQWREVTMPVDVFTRLRWLIFAALWVTAIALIPSVPYQLLIATGHEYKVLRNIVSITSGVSLVGSTVLMVLVFTYRVGGKDK